MKILIFDIYADYGCFKKFYTTSSILTYDFPPKTALIGVIGSILGYKRKSKEMKELRDIKIGIKILNQIKKIHQGINWLNTKVKSIKIDPIITSFLEPIAQFSVKDFYGFVGINKNKPSNLQLLKNPKFRIFISNENFDEYNTLVKSVKKQLYHFSPYLGQTEFLDMDFNKLKNHSIFSSLFTIATFHVLREFIREDLNDKKIESIKFLKIFSHFAYISQLIVRSHHGSLKNLCVINNLDLDEEIILRHKKRLKNIFKEFLFNAYTELILPCLFKSNTILNIKMYIEINARPGQKLQDHIYQVYKISIDNFNLLKLNIDPILRELTLFSLKIISFTHDLGKATKFFQEWIDPNQRKDMDFNKLKNHSIFSSLFTIATFHVLREFIRED
ncbi:MAG: type I-B CRISPR-associated protein Cas5b, partial [Candidatus Lokiarchaeota archaeon]